MRGSIRRRNGIYSIVYDIGKKWDEEKQQWKRNQKWETVPLPNTRKHAEQLLAERVSKIHRGEFVEPSKITFREFKEIWVQNYAQSEVRPSTMSQYSYLWRRHILPAIGSIPLALMGVEDIQSLKASKLAEGLAPQTVKHMTRLVRQMLKHAVSWKYIPSNPAVEVKDPKIPRKEMDCLNPKETRSLLEKTPFRCYPLFLIAVTAGLRIGELLAMKWSSIDWINGRYHVRETLTRKRDTQVAGFATVKTESSAQPVDLTPACLEALRQHRSVQAQEKLTTNFYEDNNLVFATSRGKPLNDRNVVNRVFHPTLAEAGIRRIRFHELRHTCASLLIAQGESPKYIQKQMRHASIQITFDTYGHLFPDSHRQAVTRLDETLFGSPKQADGTC